MGIDRLDISEIRRLGQPENVLARRNAEHWMSHLYARKVSPYFTLAAHRLGVSADMLTGVMVLIGVLGALMLAGSGWIWALGSAVMIQLYLILDCSDGELARVHGSSSARGIFLDRFGHYAVESLLLVFLGLRASNGDPGWLPLGAATAVVALLVKVQADLVTAARSAAGMEALPDVAYTAKTSNTRRARSLIGRFPVQRLLGAVELSIAILLAAIVDEIASTQLLWQRRLLVALAAIALMGVPLRLWLILRSDRLDP